MKNLIIETFEKKHDVPRVIECCIGESFYFIRKSNGKSLSFKRTTIKHVFEKIGNELAMVYSGKEYVCPRQQLLFKS